MGQVIILSSAYVKIRKEVGERLLGYLVSDKGFKLEFERKDIGFFVVKDLDRDCSVMYVPFMDKDGFGELVVLCQLVSLHDPVPDVHGLVWEVIDPFREYVGDVIVSYKFRDREELEERSRRIVRGEW